ncbi:hypothetical protein AALP_AA6G354200 [Arabis alpina]|uniref:TF-B3 domain-containing protein n=1 Tax=Arabis alpina TaxID=50452 RepID=A0A087GTS6_ARAAL|nr:hypothetical protein AALP_AA6G354200 [Arabis alpina]
MLNDVLDQVSKRMLDILTVATKRVVREIEKSSSEEARARKGFSFRKRKLDEHESQQNPNHVASSSSSSSCLVEYKRGLVVPNEPVREIEPVRETPEWLVNLMIEENGFDAKLIIEKELTQTDVSRQQNRLLIPVNKIENKDFLNEEEKRNIMAHHVKHRDTGVDVTFVGSNRQQCKLNLRRWDMNNSSNYVLVSGWFKATISNKLRLGQTIRLWSFHSPKKLYFALVPQNPAPAMALALAPPPALTPNLMLALASSSVSTNCLHLRSISPVFDRFLSPIGVFFRSFSFLLLHRFSLHRASSPSIELQQLIYKIQDRVSRIGLLSRILRFSHSDQILIVFVILRLVYSIAFIWIYSSFVSEMKLYSLLLGDRHEESLVADELFGENSHVIWLCLKMFIYGSLPRPPESHPIAGLWMLHISSGLECFTYSIMNWNQALHCNCEAGDISFEAFSVVVVWRSLEDRYIHLKGEIWLECFMQNLECVIDLVWLEFGLDNHAFPLALIMPSRECNNKASLVYAAQRLIVLDDSHNLRECLCAFLVSKSIKHGVHQLHSFIQLLEMSFATMLNDQVAKRGFDILTVATERVVRDEEIEKSSSGEASMEVEETRATKGLRKLDEHKSQQNPSHDVASSSSSSNLVLVVPNEPVRDIEPVREREAPVRQVVKKKRETPEWLVNLMREENGFDPKFICEKELTKTDICGHQSRLLIPMKKIQDTDFLNEDEKRMIMAHHGKHRETGVGVTFVGPNRQKCELDLRIWDLNRTSNYVLVSGWNKATVSNSLSQNQTIRLWSFHTPGKLFFALAPPVQAQAQAQALALLPAPPDPALAPPLVPLLALVPAPVIAPEAIVPVPVQDLTIAPVPALASVVRKKCDKRCMCEDCLDAEEVRNRRFVFFPKKKRGTPARDKASSDSDDDDGQSRREDSDLYRLALGFVEWDLANGEPLQ